MNSSLLPSSMAASLSISGLARDTCLSWATVRDVLDGSGTIASLERVRQASGLRWGWTASTDPARAGRDLAARRRSRGLSQRGMAARLGISQQTVVMLETRFSGRCETLVRYLRVLGQHDVLARPRRRLVPGGNDAEADLVYTPRTLACAIIDALRPHLAGEVLDPARDTGAFFDAFPAELRRHWCEITDGHDFSPGTGRWAGSSPTHPSAGSAIS